MKAVLLFIACLCCVPTSFAANIKEADLAGSWYPASKTELEALIKGYLDKAAPEKVEGDIFALISPHAGYQFSGSVAAFGYKALESKDIKTVIIIGFSHRKPYDGISVYSEGAFHTPLGNIAVDEGLASEIISANPKIRFEPGLFEEENSVEMQIPFVQTVFKNAKIVPIAFGGQNCGDADILANSLSAALKGRKGYLVIASTDLSHYHPYKEANAIDKRLMEVLDAMNGEEFFNEANSGVCELCGLLPVTATLLTAEKLGFNKIKILKYANSGDTFGDKTRVVGYLSAVVYKSPQSTVHSPWLEKKIKEEAPMLNDAQKKRLLQIARESITSHVKDGKRKDFTEKDPLLNETFGAFVTLHENGELRGCIGNMVGEGQLYQTVADMAVEAATGDPRFPKLSPKEISNIDIEISVLSPLKKVSSYEEIKIPGNGVLVRSPAGSGVYLPQVAVEAGWNREQFLTSLCGQKAGIAPDAWKKPGTDMYIFNAEIFGEKDK